MGKYYHTCENCGANLDPGEKCDCENETETKSDNKSQTSSDD